jgi:predicted DNA-binding protein with PD1-like motif
MKIIMNDKNLTVLRFDPGEEAVEGLKAWAGEDDGRSGVLSGLGACRAVALAFYDLAGKKYLEKEFQEDLEVASLSGNLSRLEGKPALHLHGVFCRPDQTCIGGHVVRLAVSATLELILAKTPPIKREFDAATGLNLLQ